LNSLNNLSLCYVVSSEMTITAFLKDHIIGLIKSGCRVTIVANARNDEFIKDLGLSLNFHSINIERSISPWKDLNALITLYFLFRAEKFNIVHSVSPKAGMLAMLAARMAFISNRVHTFTGQVWVTRTGLKRKMLKMMDYILVALTTRSLVDSPSQLDFLIKEGILSANKAEVIGNGAICGVDCNRFLPDNFKRTEIREKLGIPQKATVLLFVGRLNANKGVLDLANVFLRISKKFPDTWLVFVGPDEANMVDQISKICEPVVDRLCFVNYTNFPEHYMMTADIFCLPSYREGFGMVIIEAGATAIPTVASRIYGITDAVVEGKTGLLHRPGNIESIEKKIKFLLLNPKLRIEMGTQARNRVLIDFSKEKLTSGLLKFYSRLLD
jgi:glycosyltransferase involved in cell wall biosynthesis